MPPTGAACSPMLFLATRESNLMFLGSGKHCDSRKHCNSGKHCRRLKTPDVLANIVLNRMCCALIVGFFLQSNWLDAQEPDRQEEPVQQRKRPAEFQTKPIEPNDLPAPPDEIAKLIERGSVTFCTGKIPWSEMRDARDRTGVAGTRFRLAAETRAEFNYDYNSRTSWRKKREGGKLIVYVTVGFRSARLNVVHRIWFRRPPTPKDFWQDSIVQHEFDHVRLSTHPMLDKIFARNLKAASRFRHELHNDQRVDEAMVNEWVREKVKAAFDEIYDLVKIRYRELDRVTRHGMEPVPPESEVETWLVQELAKTDSTKADRNRPDKQTISPAENTR